MPAASALKYLVLAYFSKPKAERSLYRLIRRRRPTKIVEIGLGSGDRAERMLQVAARFAVGESVECGDIEYTGIDLFDARPADRPPLTIKTAHRRLKSAGRQVRLLPGAPFSVLAARANSLGGTNLLVISADVEAESLAKAWFYVPRMLSGDAVVLQEIAGEDGVMTLKLVSPVDVEQRAASQSRRRAA